MTTERWQQIEALFQAALARDASERSHFLSQSCNGDGSLRAEVELMLAAHDRGGAFLETPALEVEARRISKDRYESLAGTTLGHYRIDRLLGSGGMGEVFAATDTRTNRKVALKLLPDYFTNDPRRVLRFEQEARAVLALNHPNIVTIYEVGQSANTHYIATEFIEGETLRRRLSRESLSVNEALEIAIQICNGLVAAESLGIVHRDIKPENIMLRPDGYVKVLDFGIAKLSDPSDLAGECSLNARDSDEKISPTSTNPGVMLGTVRYMSPEQARGLKVDGRADLWSLGVTLYEMLSGRVPFDASEPVDCVAAILEIQPPPPSNVNSTVPPELQWIVNKTLRRDRDERYQTARELLGDLRELKQEIDVRARLNSLAPRLVESNGHTRGFKLSVPLLRAWRINYLVRHRWLAAASAVVLILLGVLGTKYFSAGGRNISSLAVLPFVNVDSDPNADYVADGITENLINSLSQLPNVKVIASNSVFRYKATQKGNVPDSQKVAHELGVQAVLLGRIIQHGDDLFVSAELVNADDNSHIWGAQYDRKLSAIFAVQEQIARDISQELRTTLATGSKPKFAKQETENLKAFEYYMQGRSYIHRRTREDLMFAGSYYQKAIEEDPNFALAYAGLAEVYGNLGVRGYIPPVEGRQKLDDAARKAVALDDNLADAHVMMGYYYMGYAPYDFANGDREIRRAIELSPSLAIAHLYLALSLLRQNRLDEGLNEMLKARELDPFSAIIARQVALYYQLKRDYSQALQILRQSNDLGPLFTTMNEVGIYIQNKMYDEALKALDNEGRTRKEDPILIYSRAMLYAAQGRRAEALAIVKELELLSANGSQAQWIAKIYAILNDKDQSFNWLERGLATGTPGAFYPAEPTWDPLRNDPRFNNLMRRIGVPTT
ncbi:MAG TPA: protein kinase [Pyrinomonadaceae bacterium]|jgi:serine/threonine protein kinase/Tfp pilus assembly protein PilF|nr:protein kinase [Pyrinomonadaceae bacterium]